MKLFFIIFTLTLFAGSAQSQNFRPRIYEQNGSGGIIWDHFSERDFSAVSRLARNYCSDAQLGSPKIQKIKNGCMFSCGGEFDNYEFQCGPRPIGSGETSIEDMERLGAQCVAIGFSKGTPEFGQCVLRLLDTNKRSDMPDLQLRITPRGYTQ
jgi:hypothetical protein